MVELPHQALSVHRVVLRTLSVAPYTAMRIALSSIILNNRRDRSFSSIRASVRRSLVTIPHPPTLLSECLGGLGQHLGMPCSSSSSNNSSSNSNSSKKQRQGYNKSPLASLSHQLIPFLVLQH